MRILLDQTPIWFRSQDLSAIERMVLGAPMEDFHSFYAHMFLQDIGQIVPYRSRSDGGNFFKLKTNDDELAEQILASLDTRHNTHGLDGAMREFLESVTHDFFMYGKAVYSFDFEQRANGGHVSATEPPPYSVFSMGRAHFQYVPSRLGHWGDEEARGERRHIRQLRPDSVMVLSPPGELRRFCRVLMRKLAKLSALNYPDLDKLWNRSTLENPNPKGGPFDFTEFRRRFDITLFRTIRRTGWTARDHSGAEKSDFFACVNRLRFKRFQVTLRDAILKQLNAQVTEIFSRTRQDFEFKIEPDKLFSHATLNAMEAQLYAGELAFTELIKRTYSQ